MWYSNDPDYVSLKINENYGLSMVHVSGELVPLRSAGFEHVVALSLIGALHKNAPLRGPIIMDSPFVDWTLTTSEILQGRFLICLIRLCCLHIRMK